MSTAQAHPLTFQGSGTEYARIFFVNLALSILTLGIYSAWAKVRNKRYFYGNTKLAESSFDYHASPIQILKGRILIVAIFIVYNVVAGTMPALSLLFFFFFLIAVPWIILRSTQFNMRNSSYRQIHFDFLGELGEIFIVYILLPILSAFTLWLAYPYAAFKQKSYLAEKSRFGQSSFSFHGGSKEFFKIYFTAALGVVVLMMLIGFLLAPMIDAFKSTVETAGQPLVHQLAPTPQPEPTPDTSKIIYAVAAVGYGASLFVGLLVFTYINTRVMNYFFNSLKLENLSFRAEIGYLKLLWIYFSNAVLILLTIGIFIPWAKVRAAKYKLGCITVFSDNLGGYVAAETEQLKAFGEEAGSFFDVDIGF